MENGTRVKFWCRQHDTYIHGVVISDGLSDFDGVEVECEGDYGIWHVPVDACLVEDP